MRVFFGLVVVLLMAGSVRADDPYFSQFYNTPLNLNPALTGISYGQTRLIANYRRSMSGFLPYETFAASLDLSLFENGPESGFAGAGLIIANDQTGLKASTTKAMLSFSYHLPITSGATQFISFGLQGGAYQYQAGVNGLSTQSQWVPSSGYDPSISNGENISGESLWAPDIHAGALWYAFLKNSNSVWAGLSLFHLNQPNISFYGASNPLHLRTVFHAGAYLQAAYKFYLLPNIMWMGQNGTNAVYYGMKGEYELGLQGENALSAGVWIRNTQAAIIYGDIRHKNFNLGISYEFLMSNVAEASRDGGFEISVSYLFSRKSRFKADLNSNPNPKF